MAKSLEQIWAKREPNRDAVNEHKKRMLEETRAHRLRELREDQAMTQVALAERLHITQASISKFERGDLDSARIDTLRKYIDAIGGKLLVEVELGNERIQIA
ncbi:helix-turn-helix domain-containing protein [Sinomonas humi]|uniref:XRE family transcriptional regulator n=1 Tax=Sinomonas humi TaxID=1338436 RepID=A0A0B2ATG0_9MICC|nr:helix-turn-helix transcriptional regulator [Sinomonas humi]KHL05149.1 XRE family transcriptional regulator [Sinomonas humi]